MRKSTIQSKAREVFFIDDMIPKKRLMELAELLKPLNVKWMCQLRPTKDLDFETLQILHDAGLQAVLWGVESGNQRVLDLMKKGTRKEDVAIVLENAKKVGITNVLYVMFGFPTETTEEFLETIAFLKDNQNNIDLISSAVFGLQKETAIFKMPDKFNIVQIATKDRTILEPTIGYSISSGLTQQQAIKLSQNYKKTLDKINKYPKQMNFFREHMLLYL